MTQKISKSLNFIPVAAFMFALTLSSPASAVNVLQRSCRKGGNSSEVCNASDRLFGGGSIWENIVNTLIFVIGAVAVLMIVVGGLRYITAAGDQAQVTAAKNTIIYAVAGLVLAVAAGGIVNFVLGRL